MTSRCVPFRDFVADLRSQLRLLDARVAYLRLVTVAQQCPVRGLCCSRKSETQAAQRPAVLTPLLASLRELYRLLFRVPAAAPAA